MPRIASLLMALTALLASLQGHGQNFVNPGLEGSISTSAVPPGWSQVAHTDPISSASGPSQATSDVTGLSGPNAGAGINGNPHSGNSFISSLRAVGAGFQWNEGIQQSVGGFTPGQTYTLNFYQAVVKQTNALDPSGSWNVFLDGTLLGTTAPTFSGAPSGSNSFVWQQRSLTFTAPAATINFQFLAEDDDGDIFLGSPALRMGIDSVWITSPPTPVDTVRSTLQGCDSAQLGGTWYVADQSVETYNGPAASGGDSVHIVDITILPSTTGTVDTTLCAGETFVVNGTVYGAGNLVGTEVLAGSNGCDSIVSVTVTEQPPGASTQAIAGCDSVFAAGTWYFATTTVRDTLPGAAANGCDSIVTFDIRVDPCTPCTFSTTLFDGFETTDTIDGIIPGTVFHRTPQTFCPRSGARHFYANFASFFTGLFYDDAFAACSGTQHRISFFTRDCSGSTNDYTIRVVDADGFLLWERDIINNNAWQFIQSPPFFVPTDSFQVRMINNRLGSGSGSPVVGNDMSIDEFRIEACIDSTFEFLASCNPADTGTVSTSFTNAAGCDSVHTVVTSLLPVARDTVAVSGCDSVTAGGTTLFADALVADTLVGGAANGCDSITVFDATVNPSTTTFDAVTGCDSALVQSAWIFASGAIRDTFTAANGCDSIVETTVTIHPSVTTSDAAVGCDSALVQGDWIATPGLVRDTLATVNGCDSIVETTVTINPSVTTTIDTSACEGDGFILPGGTPVTLTPALSGTYRDTLTTVNGCDSIRVVNLTVEPIVTAAPIDTSGCDSLLILGTWYAASTVVNDTLPGASAAGCDSIQPYAITIHPSVATNDVRFACDSALVNGTWYDSSQVIIDTLTTTTGCDSVVTTDLTVDGFTLNTVSVVGCDSALVSGAWVTGSGTVRDTVPGGTASGCDSITVFDVTIEPSARTPDTIAGCDSAFVQGRWVFASGLLRDTLTTVSGCDSIIETAVTVNASATVLIDTSGCEGQAFTLPDGTPVTLTPGLSGTYRDTLTTATGCDSIRVVDLTVIPRVTAPAIDTAACDSLFLLGAWYTASTTVNDTVLGSTGCDSIQPYAVTIHPSTVTNDVLNACDSALVNGTWYASSQVIVDTLTTANGCDSVVTTDLRLATSETVADSVTGCDSVLVNGRWVNTSGTVRDTLTSAAGCDSIRVTDVTIHPSVTVAETAIGCDSVLVQGTWIRSSGLVRDTFATSTGCDSIIATDVSIQTADLTVQPEDATLCVGDSVLLVATGTDQVEWSGGIVTDSLWVAPATDQDVVAIGTVLPAGCTDTDTVRITVVQPISFTDVQAIPDSSLDVGQSVVLEAASDNGLTYDWIELGTSGAFAEASPVETTVFTVEIGNPPCPAVRDSIRIIVAPLRDRLHVPTGFTPNGDGVNDVFTVLNPDDFDDLELRVHARWGDLVYTERGDVLVGWDGTYRGERAPMAVYVYEVGRHDPGHGRARHPDGDDHAGSLGSPGADAASDGSADASSSTVASPTAFSGCSMSLSLGRSPVESMPK